MNTHNNKPLQFPHHHPQTLATILFLINHFTYFNYLLLKPIADSVIFNRCATTLVNWIVIFFLLSTSEFLQIFYNEHDKLFILKKKKGK